MLSAAVSGNVFASPSVSQIVDTIGATAGSAGTILIVKNYTGDIFHFHLAAEKARARWGYRVEVLVVGDDVAVGRQRSGKVGRRGLAGTVLVHKILGALAAQGKSIDELLAVGKQVIDNLVTCGVSQGHVHIPGTAFQDEEVHVELGMGIHNEPGCQVLNPRPTLDALLDRMLDMLLDTSDDDRGYVDFKGKDPVLLVNNLGGTSQLELGAILHETVTKLSEWFMTLPYSLTDRDRCTRFQAHASALRHIHDQSRCVRVQHHAVQGQPRLDPFPRRRHVRPRLATGILQLPKARRRTGRGVGEK